MNWLRTFLEENPGVGSMMRAVHLGAFIVCLLIPLLVECGLSIHARAWVEAPPGVVNLCLGGFGAATIGKAVQSFGERT